VRRRQWRAFRKRWKRWERWTNSPAIGFGSLVTASIITALLWLILLGRYTDRSSIAYTRQHLTLAGAAHSSSGRLRIETLPDSRLRLHLFGEDGEAVWEECAP